ncbi:MAG TPA: RNA methyltransferase [Verrucomicrobiota bacterium]|nr:RNA methyltransferase [Verrucomicrobiota bacterium]
MPQFIPVTDLDRAELAPYRTMREQRAHRAEGLFVAEGPEVVRRLLASGIEVINLLLLPRRAEALTPLIERHAPDVPVFLAGTEVLQALTGFHVYQGALAQGRIPPAPDLAGLLPALPRPRWVVALDGLANAENVGTAARTAAGFGAQALLLGETCASPWLRRAVRTSMGAVFHLPAPRSAGLAADLAGLRAAGFTCVAADPNPPALPLPECDLRGDCCLVFGAEGDGLRPEVRAACDAVARVPMSAAADSLNVASAVAVFAYEVWRQRQTRR